MPDLIHIDKAAEILGWPRWKVRARAKQGKIRTEVYCGEDLAPGAHTWAMHYDRAEIEALAKREREEA